MSQTKLDLVDRGATFVCQLGKRPAQRFQYVVVDNLFHGSRDNIKHHLANRVLTFRRIDIRDYAALLDSFQGAEIVFHLAAQSNVMGAVSDIDYSFSTNVIGTFNVLKAAQACGARRLVFTSSREVYGEPRRLPVSEEHPLNCKNSYGASKLAGEVYCRVFNNTDGLKTSVVRLSNVYGQRDLDRVIPIWIERALQGLKLVVYGGEQLLDFVWIDLVVEALLRVAQSNTIDQPINIGSGTGVHILELAERILSLTGAQSGIDCLPPREAEVTRFVAEVRHMQERLGLLTPDDPLHGLPSLIEWYKTSPGTATTAA